MMNRKVLFWPLAAVLLTACEKGLDEGIADVAPAGQVTNSVLQVRTRSGGSAGGEAAAARPTAPSAYRRPRLGQREGLHVLRCF